jgi:hypothetical protein
MSRDSRPTYSGYHSSKESVLQESIEIGSVLQYSFFDICKGRDSLDAELYPLSFELARRFRLTPKSGFSVEHRRAGAIGTQAGTICWSSFMRIRKQESRPLYRAPSLL